MTGSVASSSVSGQHGRRRRRRRRSEFGREGRRRPCPGDRYWRHPADRVRPETAERPVASLRVHRHHRPRGVGEPLPEAVPVDERDRFAERPHDPGRIGRRPNQGGVAPLESEDRLPVVADPDQGGALAPGPRALRRRQGVDEGGLRRVHVLVLVDDHVAPGQQVRPSACGVGGIEDRAVVVRGARVGEFLLIAPPHGAADAPQRPDVGARRGWRAPGWLAAHRAHPGVDLQRQRAGRSVRTVADVVGRFDRPPLRIVYLDAHRPQPFDEDLGHARSVAVPGALQVPEGGLDIARRQALVQTPLPGTLLLVAGERRPAAPVVRVVLEPDAAIRRHRRLRVVRQVEVGPVAPQVLLRRVGPRRAPGLLGRERERRFVFEGHAGGVQQGSDHDLAVRPHLAVVGRDAVAFNRFAVLDRGGARVPAQCDVGGEPRVAVDLLADPAGDPPPPQAVVLRHRRELDGAAVDEPQHPARELVDRAHLEARQAFARPPPDLLGGLVREGDEGDRLGRRAEAAGSVARPRHHRPGLAGPGAGGDHRPVFEARGGPSLVGVEGRQQRVGGGGSLRAPVPPGPFRRGEAARGEPDPERGRRVGEPPPGPEALPASDSGEVEGALAPPDARGREQPAPLLDPRTGGVGARGPSRRSRLPAHRGTLSDGGALSASGR